MSTTTASPMQIGMLLYPNLTQLDLTGPLELFHRLPNAKIHLVWKDTNPVMSEAGLGLLPTTAFKDTPLLDLLFVPGGVGQMDLMQDALVLDFLRKHGENAKYVTSVCTGSLLLGAAGLLRGYRATTHWAFLELLSSVGAIAVSERVVIDRNRITAGGVTAGIDFGLRILAEIEGDAFARRTQLMLEYDPAPPFQSGHPRVASKEDVLAVQQWVAKNLERRQALLSNQEHLK